MVLLCLFCIALAFVFALGNIQQRIKHSFIDAREGRSIAEIAGASGKQNPASVTLALGACEFLRSTAIVAAAAYGLVLTAIAIAGTLLNTGIPASWVLWIAECAHSANEALDEYSLGWSIVAIVIACAALAIQAGHARRRAAVDRFQEAQERGISDLIEQKDEDAWQEIPASPQMEAIASAANDLITRREEILQQAARQNVSPETVDKKLSEQLDILRANYVLDDLLRRLRLSWSMILNGEGDESQKRWRIGSLVMSKGMATSLGTTSQVLSIVTLLLLFLSQITLGLGPATAQIARFEDLAVGKAGETAEQQLSAVSPTPVVARTPLYDSRELDFLSRRLASKYQSVTDFQVKHVSRTEAVRAEILAQDMPHDPDVTAAVGEVATKHPDAWERAKQNLSDYISSFHEPANGVEFQRVIWDNMLSVGLSYASPKNSGFAGDFAQEFAGDVTPDALRNGFHSFVERVVASVASARNKEDVAAALDQSPTVGELPPTRETALHSFASKAVANHPAKVLQAMKRSDDPQLMNIAHSAQAINELRPSVYVQSVDIMNSVSGYDDVYMSETRGHSIAFKTVSEALKIPEVSDAIAKNVGYNFAATVAAPQTGGVVIGRPFPSNTKLDIRNLTWQEKGDLLTLTLYDAEGHEKSIGPFRRDIVHQALSYVADGRIAAVTMLSTPFDLDHIAVNPSLEDSGLGCVVIDSDTWIFHSMEDTDVYKNATRQWYAINDLYKLAWATRIIHLLTTIGEHKQIQALNHEQKLATRGASIALAIQDPISDQLSHISTNTNYYDSSLVWSIKTCVEESTGSIDNFEKCIDHQADNTLEQIRMTGDKTALNAMLTSPPRFGIRSALTESALQPDNDLSFLDLDNNQPLWPFDISIQAVAESEPQMLNDEARKTYVEQNIWTFAALQPLIQANLAAYLQSHPESAKAFQSLKQFAIAQRFFRAGLSGYLGSQFPIEKLADLSRFTVGTVAPIPTPRWFIANSHPGESFMQYYISSLSEISADPNIQMTSTQRNAIETCTVALKGSDATDVSQRCPTKSAVDAAELSCENGDCTFANILRFAAFTAALRETADSARLHDPEVGWTDEKLSSCVANAVAK